MRQVDLVKGGLLQPLLMRLDGEGANVTLLLEYANLPPILLERPVKYLPLMTAWRFLDFAGRHTGDPLFSARAVLENVSHSTDQVISLSLSREPTVFEAIKAFVTQANAGTSGATLQWSISENLFWVLRRPHIPGPADSWQVEQFVIAAIAKALSHHLGRNWQPVKLKIRQQNLPENMPEDWKNAEIETTSPITAIGIKLSEIVAKSNFIVAPLQSQDRIQANITNSSDIQPDQLQEAILPYVVGGIRRIPEIAEAFGFTERTFRRRLNDAGLSFAKLINEARYRRALALLNDSSLRIDDLARELGYSHPENFTRAFRRRVGVSPRNYRKFCRNSTITS